MKNKILITALISSGVAAMAHAQSQPADTSSTSGRVPSAIESAASSAAGHENPQTVLSAIHATNQLEMSAGKLAQSKGSSEEVRQFGRQLYDDHRAADQKVQSLADRKGIMLKPQLDDPALASQSAEQAAEVAKLAKLSGPEFDTAFLSAMAKGHKQTIQQLEKVKASATDQDVESLVNDLMPVLHKHEQTAVQDSNSTSSSGH
jgi:putative membrane protein